MNQNSMRQTLDHTQKSSTTNNEKNDFLSKLLEKRGSQDLVEESREESSDSQAAKKDLKTQEFYDEGQEESGSMKDSKRISFGPGSPVKRKLNPRKSFMMKAKGSRSSRSNASSPATKFPKNASYSPETQDEGSPKNWTTDRRQSNKNSP